MNTVTSTLARLVASGLALTLVAGCGSGDDGDEEPEASEATTSATPTEEPEDFVDVPAGVDLTEAGAELDWGQRAAVAWQPRQKKVAVARVQVRRVERTSFDAAFQGFRITDQMAAMTPYFVRAQVVNPGGTDIGGLTVPLYVEDDSGTLVEPTVLEGKFAPCPGRALPTKFGKQSKTEICQVFLVPQGREFASVAMRVPGGLDPIRWTGNVRPYKPAKSGNGGS